MKKLTAKSLVKKSLQSHLKGKSGYLSDHWIELGCHQGIIQTSSTLWDSQIQPVSLDLRLGAKAYRVQSSFLPENETVETKLKDIQLYEVDLRDGG
ncbi:MAG: 2'-deoxycytidine 5'-triphosphate deaminase, partial [Nitrospinota bacterium]|nr:2'-deoxycytidine 5'-triphosphate deaminase [Nitrospinota bacterium]